jgi:murein DD-endopeptidase MepM/ murein hydrolase activator NlpD
VDALRRFIQSQWLIVLILVFIIFLVALFTYLAGTDSNRDTVGQIPTSVIVVPTVDFDVVPYAQIDPSIADYLDQAVPRYGESANPLQIDDLPQVGVYLSQERDVVLQEGAPTAMPTLLPYPTSEPLPLPYVPDNLPPTVAAFADDGTPRTLFYDGITQCAPSGRPVNGVLTQRFHAYHGGIDIGIPLGTPVIATHSGEVTFAGWSNVGYGYLVILESGTFSTYYAHNTSFNVSEGQLVGKGSIIAWSGSTGNSTGPHVHYETRIGNVPVDPLTFESRGHGSC